MRPPDGLASRCSSRPVLRRHRPAHCLFPWPNDHFTKAAATPTGRQLDLNSQSVPKNKEDVPIDPTDQNRGDGFSPGNMMVAHVPGLDTQAAFDRTGAVPITDMARSFDPDQPVVVINTATGKRQLIWAEIDSNPTDPGDVSLIIRPGRNFDEGGRYIVALRNLKKADGTAIKPGEEFPPTAMRCEEGRRRRQGARQERGRARQRLRPRRDQEKAALRRGDPVFGPLDSSTTAEGPVAGMDVHRRQHAQT